MAMEVEVVNRDGTSSGKMDLPEEIFGVKVRTHLMHQAVRSFLANQRQGNASTRGRSDIRASGRKPWRQKGLGRSRAGTVASPIWVGGGVAHGPKPRKYGFTLPKKARRAALRSALTAKLADGEIKLVESLAVSEPKTREGVQLIKALGLEGARCLFVLREKNQDLMRATGNIPGVGIMVAGDLNVYDVLTADVLVMDKDAVGAIAEVLGS
jgi:large subunit ribosomal protein L4